MAKTEKETSVVKKKSPKKLSSSSAGSPSNGPSLTGLETEDKLKPTRVPKKKKSNAKSTTSGLTKSTEATELSSKKTKAKKTSTRKAPKSDANGASTPGSAKRKHPPKKHLPKKSSPQKTASVSTASTSVSTAPPQRMPSSKPTAAINSENESPNRSSTRHLLLSAKEMKSKMMTSMKSMGLNKDNLEASIGKIKSIIRPSAGDTDDPRRRPHAPAQGYSTGSEYIERPPRRQVPQRKGRRAPAQSENGKPSESVHRAKSGDLELIKASTSPNRKQVPRTKSSDLSQMKSSASKTAGILRNSSHHAQQHYGTGKRDGSSHHARFSDKRNHCGSTDDLESISDDDSDDSVEEIVMPTRFDDEVREGLTKQKSSFGLRPAVLLSSGRNKSIKTLLDNSGHSAGSHFSNDSENVFENDPWWKVALRYIRILPPYPNERLERKRIRQFVWWALVLDFIAAMVSITTYNGVTTCCDIPIFSLSIVDINWTRTIRITTYLYLVMIFAEIIPVVRNGIPFNLLNPMLGFAITFAMFFDDRITEAVFMWIIEATAIFMEFLVYRIQSKLYHEKFSRLQEIEGELAPLFKSKKTALNSSSHHSGKKAVLNSSSHHSRRGQSSHHSKRGGLKTSNRNRLDRSKGSNTSSNSNSNSNNDEDDDNLSTYSGMSGISFVDEDDLEGSKDLESNREFMISNNPKLHKVRLLRERRILRQQQAAERTQLRYHFGGVMVNGALVCISLILIVTIASSGGLCVRDYERPVVFERNQLDKCSDCRGNIVDGRCELCEDGQMQCYYQYGLK